MSEAVEFNLNREIGIRLRTAEGEAIYAREMVARKPDADGFRWHQAWDVFNAFGPHLRLGYESPIETTIRLRASDCESPPLPPQDPADAADRLGRRMGV